MITMYYHMLKLYRNHTSPSVVIWPPHRCESDFVGLHGPQNHLRQGVDDHLPCAWDDAGNSGQSMMIHANSW